MPSFDALHRFGTNGADGMTFTLADASVTNPTALGANGGGEGFSGINGIAVSLDTWQNTSDPSSNFVGIATTASTGQSLNYVTTNASIAPLRNTVHHFVVITDSTGITVTMDGTQVLNYTTTLPPYVLLGFTGATGGFNQIHQVQNVAITAGPPPPVPTVTARDARLGAEHRRDHGHHHRHRPHRRVGRELRRRRRPRPSRSRTTPRSSPPPRPAHSAPSTSRSRRPAARPRPAPPTSSPTPCRPYPP